MDGFVNNKRGANWRIEGILVGRLGVALHLRVERGIVEIYRLGMVDSP